MRKLLASLLMMTAAVRAGAQTPADRARALSAIIQESHEGLTISVDPWTQASRYRERFPKKSPFTGGIVAMQVSFRNDSDESITIDLRQIRLLVRLSEDNRQDLMALTPEEVADTVMLNKNGRGVTSRRIPVPLGRPPAGRDKNWFGMKEDCQNAALPSTVLAAHSTMHGLVYFDLRGQADLVESSRLYIPNLTRMRSNRPLMYFDIPLGRGALN